MKLNLEAWTDNISRALEDLRRIDFGYPISENVVVSVSEKRDAGMLLDAEGLQLPELADFYGHCDGLRMPDIRNGYFLKSLSDLICGIREREPTAMAGLSVDPILVIGSTGGGQRFAINRRSQAVLMLGNGFVKDRTFKADGENVRVVASGLDVFLERILADVEAFIADRRDHEYIS